MMIAFDNPLHPRTDALEAFAHGDVSDAERQRTAAHLRDCARCQAELRTLKEIMTLAKDDADVPPMSSDLKARMLARATSGVESIIPVDDANVRPNIARRRMIMAASAAAVIGALMFIPRSGLDAGPTAGTLELSQKWTPAAPSLSVRYKAPSTLASSSKLVLKVATYTARTPYPPVTREYEITRIEDGVFSGTVTLPGGTVFARYSVASPDGKHVDDNDARGWEATVIDSASRPLYEGLWIQRTVNQMDNWERAHLTSLDMVRFYPDNPTGHRYITHDELELAGPARADSVLALHRKEIEALHRKFASAALDVTTMWEFAMLGSQYHDTLITRHWRSRMMREYPNDGGTIQQRVFALFGEKMDANARLRELDKLFVETGGQSPQLLANAFDAAVEQGDTATISRWGERLAAYGRGFEGQVSSTYTKMPAFRDRGMALLRKSLAGVPAVPATEWRTALRNTGSLQKFRAGQWQLQALGKALLETNQVDAARDSLRRAVGLGWDLKSLRALGDVELLAHDTASARAAFAWAAADTRTSQALTDTLRMHLGAAGRGSEWDKDVADGKAVLSALLMSDAIRRPFDANASYLDAAGKRHELRDAIKGRLAVVAFVSRFCAPSRGDLASLNAVAERLGKAGVQVIAVVSDETPSQESVNALAAQGYRGSIAFDDRAEVSRHMRQSGTPHYVVVEDGKTVRFNSRRADEVLAQVEALR